ncbi:MAG: LysR family transcriptional regulator [Pikeienuella sp.]
MEYVVAVAEAGSLSSAAEALHISQPSLSVALNQVEALSKRRLFIRRKGAPIIITKDGAAFVEEATNLLASAARLQDPSQSRTHRITLGCFNDLAPRYLAHAMQQMTSLEVTPAVSAFEPLAKGLIEGRIDLAITYDLGLDARFERHELTTVAPHTFIAANHPLAGESQVTLAQLEGQPLILFDEGLSTHHMMRLFQSKGLRPKIAHRVKTLEVMRSLSAQGFGVGISYTAPPSKVSYDGTPLATVKINDPEANEAIILARMPYEPPSLELAQAIIGIKAMF